MFGLLRRSTDCVLDMEGLAILVFCSLLICELVSGAVLEVEPREVLIHSSKHQERQEQHQQQNISSSSSEVVREALFSCLEVESDESRHRPRTDVIWMKNGQIIVTKGNRKYRNYGKKKKLLINDPGEEDSGFYECALSPNSTEKGRAELWIVPRVLSAPSPQILREWPNRGAAETVGVVECQVSAGTQFIEWWKESTQLLATLNLTYDDSSAIADELDSNSTSQQDSHYSILVNGSLVISSISSADEGLYKCVAVNKAGQHGMEIRVIINRLEHEHKATPTTGVAPTRPSTDINNATNNSTVLPAARNCVEYKDISFGPNPDLPTLNLDLSEDSSRSDDKSHLPYFTSVPHSCVQSLTGYRIVLNCSAAGSPTPNITWEKDGEILSTQESDVLESRAPYQSHYVKMADGSLLINPVQFEDRGRYVCRVSNRVGVVSRDVRLRVTKMEEVCGRRSVAEGGSGSGIGDEGEEVHQRTKRVVDGEASAGVHEWPWQVLLEFTSKESLCGGTLIRPDWVVTAAHCLLSHSTTNIDSHFISPEEIILRVGVYNRSTSEPHQQLLQVRKSIFHPSYVLPPNSSSKEHDIALLKLVHPVRLTEHVGPACLPPDFNDPPVGTLCTVTGWGHLNFGANWSPEVLHVAQVPLVSYGLCRNPRSYGSLITRNMLCAGWTDGGADACQNDSGGPLVCPLPNSSSHEKKRWALYGVVNFGENCGAVNKYGVYARVTKYMRWINQEMKLH